MGPRRPRLERRTGGGHSRSDQRRSRLSRPRRQGGAGVRMPIVRPRCRRGERSHAGPGGRRLPGMVGGGRSRHSRRGADGSGVDPQAHPQRRVGGCPLCPFLGRVREGSVGVPALGSLPAAGGTIILARGRRSTGSPRVRRGPAEATEHRRAEKGRRSPLAARRRHGLVGLANRCRGPQGAVLGHQSPRIRRIRADLGPTQTAIRRMRRLAAPRYPGPAGPRAEEPEPTLIEAWTHHRQPAPLLPRGPRSGPTACAEEVEARSLR